MHEELWDAQVAAVRASLESLPDGPYRRFCSWVLAEEYWAERWLQVTDVTAVTWLARRLLADLLSRHERQMAPYIAAMNVYLMYENVSDNLAIGLARGGGTSGSGQVRRRLLQAFNAAMLARLADPDGPADPELLAELKSWATGVSLYQQSLAESEYQELAVAFLAAHPEESGYALETDVRAPLCANIEAAAALVRPVDDGPTQSLFLDGLAARYAAVQHLLSKTPADLEELLQWGTDAILVVPVLAYYTWVVAQLESVRGFQELVEDGSLRYLFGHAALQVRLLNDVGTPLLESAASARFGLDAVLAESGEAGAPITATLARACAGDDPALTRLAKDLKFGEFNVCLDGVADQRDPTDTAAAFLDRLDDLGAAYRASRRVLCESAKDVTGRLGTSAVSDLVERFVNFHRALYAKPYTSASGEYAIAAAVPGPVRASGAGTGVSPAPAEPLHASSR